MTPKHAYDLLPMKQMSWDYITQIVQANFVGDHIESGDTAEGDIWWKISPKGGRPHVAVASYAELETVINDAKTAGIDVSNALPLFITKLLKSGNF